MTHDELNELLLVERYQPVPRPLRPPPTPAARVQQLVAEARAFDVGPRYGKPKRKGRSR